jgi:actin-related protein
VILQQQLLLAQGQQVEPLSFKVDPRYLSWIGASILPRLESCKDLFIDRKKYVLSFEQYKDQFAREKTE